MSATMTGTSKIVRDYVNDRYLLEPLHPSAIMLNGCADVINRLTQERDEALATIRELMEERDRVIDQERG